ncbi:Serine/threonine-protein kinase ssp1 [Spathaspora sp. JA1]|nr:Serine/threonine-protein kinase ssp1 [Spathaspora sp. JA1]
MPPTTTNLSIELDPKTQKKIINCQYKIITKIGQGQYGKVLLGQRIDSSNNYVAIKTINRIDKSRLLTKNYVSPIVKIKREIQIMHECNHPNVVKLYQVIDDTKFDKILLILEYCKFGEIDWKNYNHYYEKYTSKRTPPLTINKILRDVTLGLEYLHFKKIIHRDLKPSNLLISSDNTIKISDFGVSVILENEQDMNELGKTMGTPAFYGPELCSFINNRYSMISNAKHQLNKVIDYRIDIWSLGVTIYSLMFNDLPFTGINEFELCKNILTQDLKFPKVRQSAKCTTNDIEELNLFEDLCGSLLTKDPNDRISLSQIKQHKFTTFDLKDSDKYKFVKFNNSYTNQSTKLPSRIRKFFSKNNKSNAIPTLPSISPSTAAAESAAKSNTTLEHVDDLLDSYLDDSSSMGSIEEDIDTTDILNGIHTGDPDILAEIHTPDPVIKPVPPPLDLQPTHITVIGESSPSSAYFSPMKRYFNNNVETRTPPSNDSKPTLSSLTHEFAELDFMKPPSMIKSTPRLTSSRKNSISSSSSSLNLNGFLTDDFPIPRFNEKKTLKREEDSEEEEEDTMIFDESMIRNYNGMAEYLDNIE